MRIAYIITLSEPIGGAQIHVRDLARRMASEGHDVHLVVGGEGVLTQALGSGPVQIHLVPSLRRAIRPLRDARAVFELRGALRVIGPDLVSTHSSKAGVLGRLAARTLGVPALFTAHGWAFAEGVPAARARAYRHIERTAARWSARIVTVSRADETLALRHRVAPPGRLQTIHNGMPDVGPALRAEPSAHPPRLVTVARFQPQKDHATLLEALARLRDRPWALDLVGDGPLRGEVAARVQALGLGERVRFLGQRNDVPELLAAAQVYVLASRWEGFPRSILEAMRAGLPVVSSDVGGCRESVADGRTGFVVAPGDVGALARALERLIADPEARGRMGAEGRAAYARNFTFDRMFEETRNVYEDVVRTHRTDSSR